MYDLLNGMRVVEAASFVAAPSCALHLQQLGAEVIRVDAIGGGPDFHRWPRVAGGASLYWEGLNKGKKSVAIDLAHPEGRALLADLVTAPGRDAGLFVTNFPASGFLAYEQLRARRDDLIIARVMGRRDGRQAVDYTVNCAVGLPQMTGPGDIGDRPVNHVLPAWDLITGSYAAFALLAAERHRRETGEGQEIRIPLSDVAMASLGHLGQIAETAVSGRDRPRHGNTVFGAFGRDFITRDGHRVMIVAITPRQWSGLISALGIAGDVAAVERSRSVSFAVDEGLRFEHRDMLEPIVETAVARRDLAGLAADLDASNACWAPYRTLREALAEDDDLSERNPLFTPVSHPGGHTYLTPGAAGTFGGLGRRPPVRAPVLGEDTAEVLSAILGLSQAQIGSLAERKLIAVAEYRP